MEVEPHPKVTPESAVRTFLFVDIRGYTRFIVEHGDDAGARLLEKFGSLARRIITEKHGQVIGTAGDEAVAVFVSAREALRAAVALQAGMARESRDDPSLPLNVGIGLDTGEAVAAGDSYAGAALNLAARLCKLAGPQEVLASEGVVHVTGKLEGIAHVERGLAQLKGFREPVRVFRVFDETLPGTTEASAGRPEEPTVEAETALPIGAFLGALPSTELVERDAELHRAMAAASAVTAGSGRLVVLSGEPGIGKTRLAQEIMLTIRNQHFLVATGRCYQLHQSVPFYPFLDALGGAYASCPPALRVSVPSRWPFLCRLLPDLEIEAPPATTSTPEEQQRLFREVTAFLQAIAAELPVALMLDDLQWADGASLELLQHLARHTRGDRVLLVGTYREAEVGRHHPLEAALRDLVREDLIERISLRRLESSGTSKLIAATLGEANVSRELDTVIHQHADGNPFFTQQLVRFLVERGDVYRAEGRWVERPLRRVEVPDSVRSVIGQRLDRLSEGTQEVLREAAVLGQTFGFDALVQLTGRSDRDIEPALEEARSAGLIEERQRDRYAFDHALTQQTLYDELSARRRKKLHLAAAEGLERLPEDQRNARSAELAWHFQEAAEEGRAIPYALIAGDRARSVFANRAAEQQFTTVLEIAEHAGVPDREVEALSRRAKLYLETFQGKPAVRDYERLLELARKRGDRHLELDARLGLAGASYIVALDETDRDLISQCRAMYESASSLADELANPRAKVEALLGTRWFGDFWPEYRERARSNVLEALELSRRLGDEELTLRCELATWSHGSRQQAEANGDRLIRQLKERRDLHRLNGLYFSMMWANLDWGEFNRAVDVCDAGIRVAEEIGVPPVQYPTLKALALLQLGRYADAWESLQREVVDRDHPFGQAMQALGLGRYFFELQAFDRAAETFRDLLARAKRLRRAWMMARALSLLAYALLRAGKLDASSWEEIQNQLREAGEPVPAALKAELLLVEGKVEAALAGSKTAGTEARSEDRIADFLAAQELESRALLELGRTRECVDLADQAYRWAEKLQALPLVWRLLALKANALSSLKDEEGAQAARSIAAATLRGIGATIPDPEAKREFFASRAIRSVLREPG